MNRAFDCDNCDDFAGMCSSGDILMSRPLEVGNLSGNQINKVPVIDQATRLCKENETDLLTLLTNIHDRINKEMLVRGQNTPLFKHKVSSVIDEWPYDISYEDIFAIPDSNPFNYNDLVKCNAVVLDLDRDMLDLEQIVAQDSDNLYSGITNLRGKCMGVDNEIRTCMENLDQISDNYEPKYPKILMDLSTRHKPYYTTRDIDTPDKLTDMVFSKSCKEIPDNVSDIFANAVLVPNMISKETEYNKSILRNLHTNVKDKQLILSKLISSVPERREVPMFDPVHRFIRSMIESSSEEEEEEDMEPNINLNRIAGKAMRESTGKDEEDEEDEEVEEDDEEVEEEEDDDDEDEEEPTNVDYSPGLKLEDQEDIEKTLQEIKKEALEEPEKLLVEESKKQTGGGSYELSFF